MQGGKASERIIFRWGKQKGKEMIIYKKISISVYMCHRVRVSISPFI